MKTWTFKSQSIGSYELYLIEDRYTDGTLYVGAFTSEDDDLFTDITVNLGHPLQTEHYAFVDVNDSPWAEAMLLDMGVAKPTGITVESGFCRYPLYRFELNEEE